VVTVDGVERIILHHGSGRFLGELNMLSGLRIFVSVRVSRLAKFSWSPANICGK
jgi:thioredoxin reductase (NADPH)